MNWLDALTVGFFQAISIFPGISRSGSTIAGGMSRGLNRKDAAYFSFLMSIPIMLAAGLLAGSDMAQMQGVGDFLPVVLAGFLAAAVVGYASIHWLLKFLTHRPLNIFALYCSLLGIFTILFSYAR